MSIRECDCKTTNYSLLMQLRYHLVPCGFSLFRIKRVTLPTVVMEKNDSVQVDLVVESLGSFSSICLVVRFVVCRWCDKVDVHRLCVLVEIVDYGVMLMHVDCDRWGCR